jgi:hypothetical protein
MQNTHLHHALEITHRFEYLTPSLGLTKDCCLTKVTDPKMPHDWRGPILVHWKTEKGDEGKYQDMGMQVRPGRIQGLRPYARRHRSSDLIPEKEVQPKFSGLNTTIPAYTRHLNHMSCPLHPPAQAPRPARLLLPMTQAALEPTTPTTALHSRVSLPPPLAIRAYL